MRQQESMATIGTGHVCFRGFLSPNTTLWVRECKLVRPNFADNLPVNMHLEQYNGGAAVPTLNRNDVHRIEVLSRPVLLLQLFEAQANNLIRQIDTLKKTNDKVINAHDLLLPRLMIGKITL
jgi:type I restriction enzyme S subunit